MTIYSTISNLAFGGVTALVVVFLVRVIGLGSAAVGLLMALGGIGALVVGRLATRLGTARLLLLSALGAGLFGLLIPLTGPGAGVAFYVIGWAAGAADIAIGSIIAASFRQAYCPPSMLGRATTSMRFLGFGSVPFGALAADQPGPREPGGGQQRRVIQVQHRRYTGSLAPDLDHDAAGPAGHIGAVYLAQVTADQPRARA